MTDDRRRIGRPPTITPSDLVEAAEQVVSTKGGAALTFDAVAAAAGVSKGAVLHHFPSKDALLIAMIERLAAREALPAAEGAPDARTAVMAHVARVTRVPGNLDPVASTLLAAVARDVRFLAPLKASASAVIAGLVQSGLTPERAALVHLTLDGLWIAELLGTSPLSEAEREHFLATLTDVAVDQNTE